MRIKPTTSFPHPVLSSSTGDYGSRSFQLSLSVEEELESGLAVLSGTLSLDDPSIQQLVDDKHAVTGLMITCQDTYLDEFKEYRLGDVDVELSGGILRGPVFIRGVVVAAHDTLALNSESIDSEFHKDARNVGMGEILALTEELRFEAGLEKLAPLESIFRLMQRDDVSEGYFAVDLENESIDVHVAPGLHGFLSLLRGQTMKDVLLSSLFLPVVMTILEAMRDADAYADKRWGNPPAFSGQQKWS